MWRSTVPNLPFSKSSFNPKTILKVILPRRVTFKFLIWNLGTVACTTKVLQS